MMNLGRDSAVERLPPAKRQTSDGKMPDWEEEREMMETEGHKNLRSDGRNGKLQEEVVKWETIMAR